MTRNISYISRSYNDQLKLIKLRLNAIGSDFSFWFCDKKDEPSKLVEALREDLKLYNPIDFYLKPWENGPNPWASQIIPHSNELSRQGTEKALIFLRTDKIPEGEWTHLMNGLIIGIDDYMERAGGNKRYPRIMITPQKYLQDFFDHNINIPNYEGFRQRQAGIRVLDRT